MTIYEILAAALFSLVLLISTLRTAKANRILHREIAKRKQAERALRESEEHYRQLLDRAGDAAFLFDLDSRFKHVNKQACKSLGYSRNELLALCVWDSEFLDIVINSLTYPFYAIDANDHTIKLSNTAAKSAGLTKRSKCYCYTANYKTNCLCQRKYPCLLKKVKETKKEAVVEHAYCDAEGNHRLFEIHGYPLFDRDGNVKQILEYSLDITERKKVEEVLKWKEDIIESASSCIATADLDGRMTYGNPAFRKIWGFNDSEEFLDEPFTLYWNVSERYDEIMEALHSEGRWFGEIEGLRRDGSHFPVQVSAAMIHDKAGNPTGLMSTSVDITERKQAEITLQNAKEEADSANRAKSEFLACMSHEIRTPMNAIIGFTDLCLQTGLTGQQRDYLTKAHDSTNSLLNLINDILDFSKIETGKLEIEHLPFELPAVLDNLLSQMNGAALKKGLALRMLASPGMPAWVKGDPLRLQQILTKLLDNAIKFTDSGKIEVIAAARDQRDGSIELEFAVHDSGIGIPAEQQKKLFQSFSQIDASTTRKYRGTGLGLIISKQLAEMMGGGIEVESEPGQGSTFKFTVRVERLGEEEAAKALSVHDKKTTRKQMRSLQGMRILLVEDNEINQELAYELLAKALLQVDIANNGQQALEMAGRNRYDCVLMDIQMPVMDGYEATRRLRTDKRYQEIPIIAMTADVTPSDREKCLNAGMNDHIPKPIALNRLINTLLRRLPAAEHFIASPLAAEITTNVPLRAPERLEREEILENEEEEYTAFPELPGIAVDEALGRLGNNHKLLHNLLIKFHRNQSGVAAAVRVALAHGETQQAKLLTHTLKGLAGNIGARELYRAAQDLETAIEEKNGNAEPCLKITEQQLGAVLRSLDALLPGELPAEKAEPLTLEAFEALKPLFQELAGLLTEYSTDAEGTMAAIQNHLAGSVWREEAARMEYCLGRYDFEGAREILINMSDKMGI